MGIYIILGLAAAIGFTWMGASIANKWRRRQLTKVRAHGRNQEKKAPELMRRRGYTIEAIHPETFYTLWVDEEPHQVRLEADMIVSRDGELYLVEVKTRKSASPKNTLTRRQMLEYSLHFPVDGLLLLDADNDWLYQITFPKQVQTRTRSYHLIIGILLGGLITASIFVILREFFL
ncbi:MAG: hypothetical protein ACE366_08610 [Bradymonadia bacterium]